MPPSSVNPDHNKKQKQQNHRNNKRKMLQRYYHPFSGSRFEVLAEQFMDTDIDIRFQSARLTTTPP